MSENGRNALGRGFGALLKAVDTPVSDSSSGVIQLPVDEVGANPNQPRLNFDTEKLEELSQSIKMKGVIQPIIVREVFEKPYQYELVAGERRLRATKLAGFDKIPAIVKAVKDSELRELALIENIQRSDLNPIEESLSYRDLITEHGYTQEDLAKRVGKNRSTIANMMRLLLLPEAIQNDISDNLLSVGHARSLLALNNAEAQGVISKKIQQQGLSVRDTEKLVRLEVNKKATDEKSEQPVGLSPQMNLNQDRLRERFATKVIIKANKEKGKIEIDYYSAEDFNRIFALMLPADG